MSSHTGCDSFAIVAPTHQTKPAALEVNRINVSLEIAQLLRRIARAKRTQKRFQRLMCEQMSIKAHCMERFLAMRTLFFVALALDLLALVLGELVIAQSTATRKIFLALIAFVSLLFMNITNVPSQCALVWKLVLTTRTNKSHFLSLIAYLTKIENIDLNAKTKKKSMQAINFLIIIISLHNTQPANNIRWMLWGNNQPKTTTQ